VWFKQRGGGIRRIRGARGENYTGGGKGNTSCGAKLVRLELRIGTKVLKIWNKLLSDRIKLTQEDLRLRKERPSDETLQRAVQVVIGGTRDEECGRFQRKALGWSSGV